MSRSHDSLQIGSKMLANLSKRGHDPCGEQADCRSGLCHASLIWHLLVMLPCDSCVAAASAATAGQVDTETAGINPIQPKGIPTLSRAQQIQYKHRCNLTLQAQICNCDPLIIFQYYRK